MKCPYCEYEFPDDYYEKVHVPCPEPWGDGHKEVPDANHST